MCDDRDKHFSSVRSHKTLSPSSRFVTQYSLAECAESAFSKSRSVSPAGSVGASAPTVGRGRHRRPAPHGERKTCLQVAFLMGLPVKSAFALLLTRVTEPRTSKFMRLEV